MHLVQAPQAVPYHHQALPGPRASRN